MKISQVTWNSPFTNRVLFEAGWSSFWTAVGRHQARRRAVRFHRRHRAVHQRRRADGELPSIAAGIPAVPGPAACHLARLARLRFGQPQPEGRLPGRLDGGEDHHARRPAAQLHLQQRHPDPAAAARRRRARQRPAALQRLLRPGCLDARPPDGAGRLALRDGVELQPRRARTASSSDHRFGPPLLFPRVEGVKGYRDITPRVGAAYDVFGTGSTAVKFHLGQYLQGAFSGEVYTINNPAVTLVQPSIAPWTDPNGNRVAECDFLNPAANGECGPWNNLQWGSSVQTTRVNPDVLEGWGVRNRDWQSGISVQQRALAAGGARGQLQPPLVEQLLQHAQRGADARGLRRGDDHGAAASAPARRRRIPGLFLVRNNRNPTVGVDRSVLHDQPGLRRRDALLARRGRVAQRASAGRPSCRPAPAPAAASTTPATW